MLQSLFWTVMGALLYKALSTLILSRERRSVFDQISLQSLGILHRVQKSLDIFNRIRTKNLENTLLSTEERKASIEYYQEITSMELEMLTAVIYRSFPENYKKYSLYTNWSEAKEIIREMKKNKLL